MFQICYRQKIIPELKEEYKKAHENIWPEYKELIRSSGLHNNSIFFEQDGTLVLYSESLDPEDSFAKISSNPLNDKWQKEMDQFIIKPEKEKIGKNCNKSKLLEVRKGMDILEQIFYLK